MKKRINNHIVAISNHSRGVISPVIYWDNAETRDKYIGIEQIGLLSDY